MIQEVAEGFKEAFSSELFNNNSTDVKAVVDFETKLAAITPSEEDREDVQKYYNSRSLNEAAAMIPQIDITAMIKRRNSKFNPKKVIVNSPSYLTGLSKLLEGTENGTIVNYLTLKTVQSFLSAVEADPVVPWKRFNNVLGGREPDAKPDRWRTCLRYVDDGLGKVFISL